MEKILVKQCHCILRTILPKMNVLCSFQGFMELSSIRVVLSQVLLRSLETVCSKYTNLRQEGSVSTVTEIFLF